MTNTVKHLSIACAIRGCEDKFYATIEATTSKWIASVPASSVHESFFDYHVEPAVKQEQIAA